MHWYALCLTNARADLPMVQEDEFTITNVLVADQVEESNHSSFVMHCECGDNNQVLGYAKGSNLSTLVFELWIQIITCLWEDK